jgi:plasmid stability protein
VSNLESWSLALPETVLTALRLRAARQGVAPADVAQALLQQALSAEIRELSGAPPLAAVIGHLVAAGSRKKHRPASLADAGPAPSAS